MIRRSGEEHNTIKIHFETKEDLQRFENSVSDVIGRRSDETPDHTPALEVSVRANESKASARTVETPENSPSLSPFPSEDLPPPPIGIFSNSEPSLLLNHQPTSPSFTTTRNMPPTSGDDRNQVTASARNQSTGLSTPRSPRGGILALIESFDKNNLRKPIQKESPHKDSQK